MRATTKNGAAAPGPLSGARNSDGFFFAPRDGLSCSLLNFEMDSILKIEFSFKYPFVKLSKFQNLNLGYRNIFL